MATLAFLCGVPVLLNANPEVAPNVQQYSTVTTFFSGVLGLKSVADISQPVTTVAATLNQQTSTAMVWFALIAYAVFVALTFRLIRDKIDKSDGGLRVLAYIAAVIEPAITALALLLA